MAKREQDNGTALFVDEVPTPLGEMTLVSDGEALHLLEWSEPAHRWQAHLERHYAATATAATDPAGLSTKVAAWFRGNLDALDDIAVRPAGTPFQQRVWARLREVPLGQTLSYAELAERVGLARNAARAVGAANGANPVAIVIPCHRIVGSDGKLTGYAGGIDRKHWLLRHEGSGS